MRARRCTVAYQQTMTGQGSRGSAVRDKATPAGTALAHEDAVRARALQSRSSSTDPRRDRSQLGRPSCSTRDRRSLRRIRRGHEGSGPAATTRPVGASRAASHPSRAHTETLTIREDRRLLSGHSREALAGSVRSRIQVARLRRRTRSPSPATASPRAGGPAIRISCPSPPAASSSGSSGWRWPEPPNEHAASTRTTQISRATCASIGRFRSLLSGEPLPRRLLRYAEWEVRSSTCRRGARHRRARSGSPRGCRGHMRRTLPRMASAMSGPALNGVVTSTLASPSPRGNESSDIRSQALPYSKSGSVRS